MRAKTGNARDYNLMRSQIRKGWSGYDPEFPLEKDGRRDPHAPALERNRRDIALATNRMAGESRETLRRFVGVRRGDPDCAKRKRAIRVIEKFLAPYQL